MQNGDMRNLLRTHSLVTTLPSPPSPAIHCRTNSSSKSAPTDILAADQQTMILKTSNVQKIGPFSGNPRAPLG
jgi:hypothetical protein